MATNTTEETISVDDNIRNLREPHDLTIEQYSNITENIEPNGLTKLNEAFNEIFLFCRYKISKYFYD